MVFSRFLNCAGFGGTVSATFTVAITTVITTAIATTTTLQIFSAAESELCRLPRDDDALVELGELEAVCQL